MDSNQLLFITKESIFSAVGLWTGLGIISIVLLVIYFRGKNAVWGAMTIAVIFGLIASIFRESGFEKLFIAKCAIVGTLIGFSAELLGNVSDKLKERRKTRNFD